MLPIHILIFIDKFLRRGEQPEHAKLMELNPQGINNLFLRMFFELILWLLLVLYLCMMIPIVLIGLPVAYFIDWFRGVNHHEE